MTNIGRRSAREAMGGVACVVQMAGSQEQANELFVNAYTLHQVSVEPLPKDHHLHPANPRKP